MIIDDKKEIQKAEKLYSEGKIDEAISLFKTVVENKPDSYVAYNNMGVIFYEQGYIKNAEKSFKKALSIKEDYPDALLNIADYYQNKKDFAVAAENLEKLLNEQNRDVHLYNRTGTLYLEAGNKDKARDILSRSLEIDPNQETVRESLRLLENKKKGVLLESGVRGGNLLFLELPGTSTGGFLDHIVSHFEKQCNVKYLITNNEKEITESVKWADIVWLEWGNQMAIHVTNRVPQIKDKKVICRIHGYEVFTDMPSHINWDVVDHLVFVAKHKQEIFNQKFKVQSPPQSIIRNGVDIDKFSISSNKRNTKHLVLIGHLNFRKGLPMLIQFYNELLKRDPEFHLSIRGEFQDHRLQMSSLTMIKELGIENKIDFVDWVEDLNKWLEDKSHILSFSLEESFHYAIGDGMAAGLKPVIHAWTESREIWPNEFIFNDLNGFLNIVLSDEYNPKSYRDKLADFGLMQNNQVYKIEELFGIREETIEIPIKRVSEGLEPNLQVNKPGKTKKYRNVFIIGLKRSGTTIFWETFRQDKRFASFDEPFRPHLRAHVEKSLNDKKKTMDEYFVHSDIIKKHWSHIQPYEETLPDFISHQKHYIKTLLGTSNNVCIDFVRCHTKINALRKIAPDALIIHLIRDPRAFVSSHLKPYGKWLSNSLPENFFKYNEWFDFWQYQTLADVLGLEGFAHEKLLSLWKIFTDAAAQQYVDMTIQFEDFATNPDKIMRVIYNSLDLEYQPLDYTKIHLPNPPYQMENTEWNKALNLTQIETKYLYQGF